MKAEVFRAARQKLDMTRDEIGIMLGDGESRYSARAVTSWENGTNQVPPAVAKVVKLMMKSHGMKP